MKLSEWRQFYDNLPGPVRDILFVAVVVGVVSLVSQLALGVWSPMVAVESGSMIPNLNIGDIVVVQGASRTEVIPWDEGEKTGYQAFNNPGDVILYRPYGKEKLTIIDQLLHVFLGRPYPPDKATPIIHRALRHVETGEPMWDGGPPAPFSGYITKGDHNSVIDQKAGMILGVAEDVPVIGSVSVRILNNGMVLLPFNHTNYVVDGISMLTPVRDEWVIGVARFKIPLVGYVRLLPGILVNKLLDLMGRS